MLGNSHVLKVLTVSGKVEKMIADSIQQTDTWELFIY